MYLALVGLYLQHCAGFHEHQRNMSNYTIQTLYVVIYYLQTLS